MSPRFASRATVLSAAAMTCLVATPVASAHEIVSRVGGPGSDAFAAKLLSASSDGRWVALRTTAAPWTTLPDGETRVESPTGVVIRDQVEQTVEPLTFTVPNPGGGSPIQPNLRVIDISDDGDRLFVTSTDGAFKAAVGEQELPGWASAGGVIQRSTNEVHRLPSYAGRPVMDYAGAALSADGSSLIYTTQLDPTQSGTATIVRGPVGGAATKVLDLPDAFVWDASDDLQTFTYERILNVLRPTPEEGRQNSTATRVIGLKRGDDAPRRVADGKFEEFLPTTGTCTNDRITWRMDYTYPELMSVSGDGSRVTYWTSHATSANPDDTSVDATRWLRQRNGERRALSGTGTALLGLGRSHDLADVGPAIGSYEVEKTIYVDDDRTKYSAPSGQRYVWADAVPLDGVPSTTGPLTFRADEPIDTDTAGNAIWRSCSDVPPILPVGTFSEYAKVALARPARAGRSLGAVVVSTAPAGKRTADKVTVEVRPFGLPKWTASRTTSGVIALPNARLLRPTIITVKVQPSGGATQLTSQSAVLPLF